MRSPVDLPLTIRIATRYLWAAIAGMLLILFVQGLRPATPARVEYVDRWRVDLDRRVSTENWVQRRDWSSDQRNLRITRKFAPVPPVPGQLAQCSSAVLVSEVIEDTGVSTSGSNTSGGSVTKGSETVKASGETHVKVTHAPPQWAVSAAAGLTFDGERAYSASLTRRLLGPLGAGVEVVRAGDETAVMLKGELRW